MSWRRRQVSAAAAGFWAAATTKDHMDVDHGDDFVGDVELDEDLDVVVQLDVDVRLGVVSGSKQCRLERLDVDGMSARGGRWCSCRSRCRCCCKSAALP